MIDIEIGDGGLTLDLMRKMNAVPPVKAATYSFVVDEITETVTQAGRPRWVAWLKIQDSVEYPNSRLPHGCVLPWINPQSGKWDASGSFAILDLIKGTGKAELCTGDIRQPDVQQRWKDVLQGAVGFMRVGQKPNRDDAEVIENTVKIIAAKR